jgi:hypothetical protein
MCNGSSTVSEVTASVDNSSQARSSDGPIAAKRDFMA